MFRPCFVVLPTALVYACASGEAEREPLAENVGGANATELPAPNAPSNSGGGTPSDPEGPNSAVGGSAPIVSPTAPDTGGNGGSPTPPAPVPDPIAGAGGSPPSNGGRGGTGGMSGGSGTSGEAGSSGTGGTGEDPAPSLSPLVVVGGFDDSSDTYPLRVYDLDKATGALTQRGNDVDVGPNPSYLTLSPAGDVLYVANERDDASGGLSAASIASDGSLTFLNHQTGSDGGFTFVAVDPGGRFAFGASYNGGSVSVFPIEADGSLGPELETRDFGDGAQSHAVGFDATGEFVFVPNKGNDEVAQLVLGDDGTLTDNAPPAVGTMSGSGPRHFALHPSGSLALVINELDSTLTAHSLASDGTLGAGTPVSTLPSDFNGQNSGAHVEVSPDGRFAYGSNRGHDSIAVFAVDAASGALTLIEHEPTAGDTPRDFEMDPEGDVLIVANQDSGTLAVFSIAHDGTLSPLGQPVNGPPSPAAVQMMYVD